MAARSATLRTVSRHCPPTERESNCTKVSFLSYFGIDARNAATLAGNAASHRVGLPACMQLQGGSKIGDGEGVRARRAELRNWRRHGTIPEFDGSAAAS